MTSPVLAALASARAKEERDAELALDAGVRKHLNLPAPQGDVADWHIWREFCDGRKIAAVPAVPASIAVFVLNFKSLGDTLAKVVESISNVHVGLALADPTRSDVVIAALAAVIPAEQPPHSFPKEQKAQFARLPRDLQKFVADHTRKIVTEMRRAQNAAAKQKGPKPNGSTFQDKPASAAGNAEHK